MNALAFAWRSLVRQPARATLGVLGVAAVGALLLNMLLLSEGLVSSMRDLLDRTGYDIRVTATGELPGRGPRIAGAAAAVAAIGALPEVRSAVAARFADAHLEREGAPPLPDAAFHGVAGTGGRPWVVLRGREIEAAFEVVVNEIAAARLAAGPGDVLSLRAECGDDGGAMPPLRVTIAGVAEFPFGGVDEGAVAASLETFDAACGEEGRDEADLILVTSAGDTYAAADAVGRVAPELHAVTNMELVGRFRESGFTYFRQISAVLSTVTIVFALLLITVLLTVSVNGRLGEIAALRALGFSRRRVVADVFCESALIVGTGGLLSLPLGGILAAWLDRILKQMPGIPADMHFFVFDTSAFALHAALLVVTACVAAVYPMQIVARLPIAATLRNEIVS